MSNSDCHSPWPWRLGRECNVFELEKLTFWEILDAVKNKDKKKAFNNDRGTEIAKRFWSNTENKFYELIKKLYDSSHKLTDEERFKLKRDWYRHIKDEATKLFNLWAFKSSIQTNPRRIAEAHNKLLYRRS